MADGIACFKSCKLFWQLSRSRVLWEHLYENTYGSDFVRKEVSNFAHFYFYLIYSSLFVVYEAI